MEKLKLFKTTEDVIQSLRYTRKNGNLNEMEKIILTEAIEKLKKLRLFETAIPIVKVKMIKEFKALEDIK